MIWKPIKGYEGYYEVSDHGDVRSLDRDIVGRDGVIYHIGGRMMKQSNRDPRGDGGYKVVNLHKYGESYVANVHILVATAFLPNPDNLPTVNHKDGNKHNNCVDNLEWASYRDNNLHALNHGLRSPRGNPVAQYNDQGEIVAIYRSSCEAARKTGIGLGMISHCINGRATRAGGFAWRKLS